MEPGGEEGRERTRAKRGGRRRPDFQGLKGQGKREEEMGGAEEARGGV